MNIKNFEISRERTLNGLLNNLRLNFIRYLMSLIF